MKPDNVLLCDGVCKLTDFGTATMRAKPRTLAEFQTGMDVYHDIRGAGRVLSVTDKVKVKFRLSGESHSYNSNSVQQGKLQPLEHAQKQGKKTVEGTQRYMAPEVMNYPDNDPDFLNGSIASSSVDVWACGCIGMELCTGKPPFVHRGEGMMAVLYVARLSLKNGDTADVGQHDYEPTLLDFIQSALNVDPRKRPRCQIHAQSSSPLQQLAHTYEPAEEEAAEEEAELAGRQSSESESSSGW